MKFKLFFKLNKKFFIILLINIFLNIINLFYILLEKNQIIEYNSVTIWYLILSKNIGEILILILPIFIIIGSSNNIIEHINSRFISHIHIRLSKLKNLCIEIIKIGIFGGLIVFIPQLIIYLLCLIFFDHHHDGILSLSTRLGVDNNFQFIHMNLIQMFLYGVMIALLSTCISLIIKHKYFYVLTSIFVYYAFTILFYISIDEKLYFVNFYSPFSINYNITFSYYINIMLITIFILIFSIIYLFIEKFVEDELYA